MSTWSIIQTVAPVFLLYGLGMMLRRMEWLRPEVDEKLARLVMDVFFPCLIIHHVVGNPEMAHVGRVLAAPLLGFGTVAFGMLLAFGLGGLAVKEDAGRKSFAYSAGIYNYAFIPIALVSVLFTEETLGLLFVYNLGVHVCAFSVGVLILSGGRGGSVLKRLINGPLIGVALALVLDRIGVRSLPAFASSALGMLGAPAVPLGLLLAGAGLYETLSRHSVRGARSTAVWACLLRLGVLPACFLLLARLLPWPETLKQILVVQAAMPAGMFTIVVVRYYRGDILTSSVVIAATTLLSIITMPLWLMAGMRWVLGL